MEIADIHEPGDRVWTISKDGQPRVWQVRDDGSLMEVVR